MDENLLGALRDCEPATARSQRPDRNGSNPHIVLGRKSGKGCSVTMLRNHDDVGDGAAPRVSVILVTYNQEAHFEQAVESVLAQQTDFPFEIIISEDCSTDRTGELAEAVATKYPGMITLLRSPANLKTNEVTTRAIEIARGEYVAFIDGDDYWTAVDKLQKQVRFLDSNPGYSLCFHDVVVVNSAGEVIEQSFRRLAPGPDVGEYADIVRCNYIAGPSAMIRRSAIGELPGWFEHAEFGDWPLYILAAERGFIGFMPEVLGAYRQHAGGYWNRMSEEEKLRRCVRMLERVSEHSSPVRHAALSRATAELESDLILCQLRRGAWRSAARTLANAVLRGLLARNAQLIFSIFARAFARLRGRFLRRGFASSAPRR